MKIHMVKSMFKFPPSVKNFNGKSLERRGSVGTKRAIVNRISGLITPALSNLMISQNTRILTYMNKNKNDIYQGLI